jgi:uncharacterized membrane protein YfcA
MDTLSPLQAIFCAVVVIAGFAVRGGAGFGGGVVTVPLLVLVLPIQLIVPVMTTLNFLASIRHGVRDRRMIQWRDIKRLMPAAFLGVGLGLYLFKAVDARPLSRALGVFVIFYAIYMLATAGRLPQVAERWAKPLAAVMGAGAGLVGTLFGGAAGPLFVIYLNTQRLSKDQFRATMTAIMMGMSVARIGGYASLGFLDLGGLKYLAAAIPLMLVGGYLGDLIVRHIDQRRFERVLGVVLIGSGVVLLLK